MIPAFIIHSSSCHERHQVVQQLQEQTNAILVEAIILPNRKEGCMESHLKVAKQAQEHYPNQSYLVFEDDCVLNPNWREAIKTPSDVTYLGYNELCSYAVFGTHALLISPKARDILLETTRKHATAVTDPWAFDWILSFICKTYKVSHTKPSREDRNKYCFQKLGLKSQITGNIR